MRGTHRLGDDQRVHIEGQEQTVEEVVRQYVIEKFAVDYEDVVQVVEVVEVLCHQVT